MELAYQTSVSQFFKISNHYRRFIQRIQLIAEKDHSRKRHRNQISASSENDPACRIRKCLIQDDG